VLCLCATTRALHPPYHVYQWRRLRKLRWRTKAIAIGQLDQRLVTHHRAFKVFIQSLLLQHLGYHAAPLNLCDILALVFHNRGLISLESQESGVPAGALASKLSTIASSHQQTPSPVAPSAPKSKAKSTYILELVTRVHLCFLGDVTPHGSKRKTPPRAATKSTTSPRQKSLYGGWTVQGSGAGREIPWSPLHEAFDKVELTPPTSNKGALPRVMQKGDVVHIKGDLERSYVVYWLQGRNMEPTGWDCAVGCGSNSSIIPWSEIVVHASGEPRDVTAAATAYWDEKSTAYNAVQEKDAEQKRRRDEAAHSTSKRQKAVCTAQHSVAPKAIHGPSTAEAAHATSTEIADLRNVVLELKAEVAILREPTVRLTDLHNGYQSLFLKAVAGDVTVTKK